MEAYDLGLVAFSISNSPEPQILRFFVYSISIIKMAENIIQPPAK